MGLWPTAAPRPGHPGQLAGLPRYSRGGRGEGGAYSGSPAGARRTEARARGDWREAGGGAADAAAEPWTAPPSLRARAWAPPRARVGEGAEDERRRCEKGIPFPFFGIFGSKPLQFLQFGKRHYNLFIRISAIIILSLSWSYHFLCIPHLRAHCQSWPCLVLKFFTK